MPIANTNPTTGIRYGCAMARDLAEGVWDDVETGEVYNLDPPDEEGEEVAEYGIDSAWEGYFEAAEYLYTTEVEGPDGKPGRLVLRSFNLGGADHVWVEDSPWTCTARECSPCVPNAGDLKPPGERPQLEPGDAWAVLCYDLPPDWWRNDV